MTGSRSSSSNRDQFDRRVITAAIAIGRAFGRALGVLPRNAMMQRSQCRFVAIALKGVPNRLVRQAIRLHLMQLGVFARPGFVYRAAGDHVDVWYWDDDVAALRHGRGPVVPWPEPLLRPRLAHGVRLSQNADGFDAEAFAEGGFYTTRYFGAAPNQAEWDYFLKDAGVTGQAEVPVAQPQCLPQPGTAPEGWSYSTELARPLHWIWWAWCVVCLCFGAALIIEQVRIHKLDSALAATQHNLSELRRVNEEALDLRARIDELNAAMARLNGLRSESQLVLLADLAATGIIGDDTKIYLKSWVLQQGSVTAVFQIHGALISRADFTSRLLQEDVIESASLMPDSAPGTLTVRMRLRQSSVRRAVAPEREIGGSSGR